MILSQVSQVAPRPYSGSSTSTALKRHEKTRERELQGGERGAQKETLLLESLLNAECAPSYMLYLPSHVFSQTDLVMGQHLQHKAQVQPPLLLG